MLKLSSPGLYLLGPDKNVQVSLDEFLLVLFHSPSSSSSGLVLEHSQDHTTDFLAEIKELYQKYSNLPDVDPALIKVKIFGTKPQNGHLVSALRNWLTRNQIPIVSSDFGKELRGFAQVDCKIGKLGIEGPGNPERKVSILSTGTLRNRFHNHESSVKILVLSHNSNTRILAKQAIEEEVLWEAHCPENLSLSSLTEILSEFKFSALIISNDFSQDTKIQDLLLDYIQNEPKVVLGCIGAQLPHWTPKKTKLLPPLEPYLIPRFKKILRHCFSEILFSETSEMISFPQKKKA